MARLVEYGRCVRAIGYREQLFVAAMPSEKTMDGCLLVLSIMLKGMLIYMHKAFSFKYLSPSDKIHKKYIMHISFFLGILLLTFYISTNWYQFLLIQGESMRPTYHNMQLVILDRNTDDYTYGDVIAFQCAALGSVLVKRIAACPGDEVHIEDGNLYVNGIISSVYSKNGIFEYAGMADSAILLDDGQYFVIGDNIKESKDSRYQEIGCIEIDTILGKVMGDSDKDFPFH